MAVMKCLIYAVNATHQHTLIIVCAYTFGFLVIACLKACNAVTQITNSLVELNANNDIIRVAVLLVWLGLLSAAASYRNRCCGQRNKAVIMMCWLLTVLVQ
jgi:hypothetical protein